MFFLFWGKDKWFRFVEGVGLGYKVVSFLIVGVSILGFVFLYFFLGMDT